MGFWKKGKLNIKNLIVKEKGNISQEDNVYELQEILEFYKDMLGV